jgi:hypothetical protein
MAKELNRIYPCFLSQGAAPSATSISRCSNSPSPLVASTAASRAANPATLRDIKRWSRQQAPALMEGATLVALRSIWPRSRRVGSAAPQSPSLNSVCLGVLPRPGTPSTAATARRAAQYAPCSGTWTTQSELAQTSARRTWQRTTGSPSPSTTRCSLTKAASAPSVERMSPMNTAGQERSSGSQSTTVTRRAQFAAFSASGAIAQSGSSVTIRPSCARPSVICFGIAPRQLINGGRQVLPSIHRGGQ